jgi:hypothetical protein
MSQSTVNEPAIYKIRAQGVLDRSWADRVEGMHIDALAEADAPAITTLTGPIADQAALENVLYTLYTLGLPLISVERLSADQAGPAEASPSHAADERDPVT